MRTPPHHTGSQLPARTPHEKLVTGWQPKGQGRKFKKLVISSRQSLHRRSLALSPHPLDVGRERLPPSRRGGALGDPRPDGHGLALGGRWKSQLLSPHLAGSWTWFPLEDGRFQGPRWPRAGVAPGFLAHCGLCDFLSVYHFEHTPCSGDCV